MQRINYILVRLLQMIPVALGITIILFFLLRAIPGDPAVIRLGDRATPEGVANLHRQMGLDKPIWTQYLIFFKGCCQIRFREFVHVCSAGDRSHKTADAVDAFPGCVRYFNVNRDHRANGYDRRLK